MFLIKCFCKENISKIVRPLLTALSVYGLKSLCLLGSSQDSETSHMGARHHYHGLSQDLGTRYPELTIVKFWAFTFSRQSTIYSDYNLKHVNILALGPNTMSWELY